MLAYSVDDGKVMWRSELDGPCISHLFLVNNQIVVAADSLYYLEPRSGEVQGSPQWPRLRVAFAAGMPSHVLLFRAPSGAEMATKMPRRSKSETLFMFEGTRLIRKIPCSRYAMSVRFSPITGLLYASGIRAIDILNPETGECLHTLPDNEPTGGFALPEVSEDRLYLIDGKGVIRALRHPSSS